MYSKGADVDALRASAHRITVLGREVDEVRWSSRRVVSTMQQAWAGPDLQHLLERWRRVEHELVAIGGRLDAFSRRLHENAEDQGRSSGRGGHGDAHGGTGQPGHRPADRPAQPPGHPPGHQPTRGDRAHHGGTGASPAAPAGHGAHGAHLAAAAATHLGSPQWAPSVHWAPAHGSAHASFVGPVCDPAWVAGAGRVLGLPITPTAWWDGGRPALDPGPGCEVPHVSPYAPR